MPLKLPNQYSPGFGTKGVKPSNYVEKKTGPLSKGLYRAFFSQSSGFYEVATGNSYFSASGIAPKFGKFGGYNQCSGTQSVPIPERIYGNTEDFTITWLASKDVATSNDGMVCGDTGSNSYYVYMSGNANQVSIKRQTETDALVISSVSHDEFVWRSVIVCPSQSTVTYVAKGQTASSGIIGRQFKLNNITFGYNNSGNKFDGKFQDIIFHDRALTVEEVNALHADPYQILKPANEPLYFVSSGAGSTYTLTADVTSYTLGSDSVNLEYHRVLSADATSYTLGSDTVNLTYNTVGSYTLTADATSYSLGSESVSLLYHRTLSADVTSYTLGSDSVNLTYEPTGAYTLNADVTSYTLGGDSVDLQYHRIFNADVTNYSLTFADATLTLGILSTPNCYTWLDTEISQEFAESVIDDSPTYLDSSIDSSVTFLSSVIDDSITYLDGEICACP